MTAGQAAEFLRGLGWDCDFYPEDQEFPWCLWLPLPQERIFNTARECYGNVTSEELIALAQSKIAQSEALAKEKGAGS